MEMGKRIKELRTDAGLSQEELGKKLSIGKSAVAKYENGRVTNIKQSTIEKMAKIFQCNPSYVMGYDNDDTKSDYVQKITVKKYPMLGEIACGKPIFTNEERESYVASGTNIDADFCLKAKGDSMIGARIHDGDIVFIKSQPEVNNGEVAVVVIGDEVTLKRVYYNRENNFINLVAENPAYPPMTYSNSDLDSIYILGKAVAFQSDVK